mgnify:CR=1 FL=1
MPQTSGPTLSDLNINILCGRHVVLDSNWYANDICSPYSRIYMVTAGEGVLRYGEETLVMTPGNIYVIPSGLRFSFSTEKTLSKTFFHISVITPGGYDIFERLNRCLVFPGVKSIKEITNELKICSAKSIFIIKAFLYELVCRCTDEMDDIRITKTSEPVMQALKYIAENPAASLTAENIADALFVSPAKLRKAFSAEIGIPLGQYITDRVLIKAEESLRTSNLTIKEISEALGFCDRYYFSRCFAKKFGLPPAEYRKKIRT